MFDLTLQVIHIEVLTGENSLELQLLIGIQVPGPEGQPAILPMGVVRSQLGRDVAIKTGNDLVEKGEALVPVPKPSGIVVPDTSTVASVNQERNNGS